MPTPLPGRLSPKLVLISLALTALAACGPRYRLFRAELPGTSPNVHGWPTYRDSLVEITYNLWSPDGAATVTVHNRTDTTLLIYLHEGEVFVDDPLPTLLAGLELEGDYLGGGSSDFPLVRSSERTYIKLAPARWCVFNGPPLLDARLPRRERRRSGLEHRFDYRLAFVGPGGVHAVEQEVLGSYVQAVGVEAFAEFQGGRNLGSYYFHDRYFHDPAASSSSTASVESEDDDSDEEDDWSTPFGSDDDDDDEPIVDDDETQGDGYEEDEGFTDEELPVPESPAADDEPRDPEPPVCPPPAEPAPNPEPFASPAKEIEPELERRAISVDGELIREPQRR